MASIWAESLGRNLDGALDLLAAAVHDCTDALWETPMWHVPDPATGHEIIGPDGNPVTDPTQRGTLVQRQATPWGVAWHALEVFDYDLNGDFGPWAPPDPFTGHPHWRDITRLPAAWSRSEMLAYIDYCRRQMSSALADMTDEKAATPLPPHHRYRGQPHAWIITGLLGHTTEHAAQIRQFITASEAPTDR